ncbi:MAG: TIGR02281 family clan AA aspartic protease [gamma proteobacterium symbiont of Bathyaustriella thionipta]|nr:TIGR02281 family clan AA aspartic protease [gamma proteobacterium symbiont of Bathyaustriella thionipta]MCU7948644.1 TIGR02281 family clan AA aspartic protease [gamma proteobacterium symbiont of Bathyaustriella thionipta]MCU7953050.1 TIGR02281 family clan AA aspartic protease [gamma proteobacterium symbiont of Bathyaustriella thionipta]MCU7955350.1 TIGR02281 family clan AA aspartic protease [gamma proteobacterium symbiont of Bathyaustriella thionipta]MCU7967852.1 TIGR02281 family clan AA asp
MDQNKGSKHQSETKRIGTGMIVIAMIIGLGLLTQIFQNVLDEQYNPNQIVRTSQINNNFVEITLKRNRSGHYVSTGMINGSKTVFLLDTGATFVAVPQSQAQRLGLKKGRKIQISTANGRSTGYQTTINQLSIGEIHLYNIKAIITPNLEEILLGMSVLKQLEFTQRGNELTIRQFL